MKITVVTQAYNARNYIEKCIKSVLEQTYSDFEYIIVDNGCNDGTEKIIEQYAESDSRIKRVRYEQNEVAARWYYALKEIGTGKFFSQLDADDWLEPDYLEHLVNVASETNSDIVSTGSVMHFEETSQIINRDVSQQLIIDMQDFASAYSYYHCFFRAGWAKLFRTDIITSTPIQESKYTGVAYGADTVNCFAWLRKANRICIDNSVLHHYRIHQKSVSHKYDPRQSYSDIYLFNDALDFLAPYGPVSEENMTFLYRVYANAISDTVANIKKSYLPPQEKISEYQKILARKETTSAYQVKSDDTANSKSNIFIAFLEAASELTEETDDFRSALKSLCPNCSPNISVRDIDLYNRDDVLKNALFNDNPADIVKRLLELISKGEFVKQYDLVEILSKYSADKGFVTEITDIKFIRKYGEIYFMLWQKKYVQALDKMTEIILNEKVSSETFYQVYLTLAAMLESVDEFILGKVKLAKVYCDQKQTEECRAVLDDLADMGVEDNDEITEIKAKLENQ